jgi:hypothetical protein
MESVWIELRDKEGVLYVAPSNAIWKVFAMTEDGEGQMIVTFQHEDGRRMTFLAEETSA